MGPLTLGAVRGPSAKLHTNLGPFEGPDLIYYQNPGPVSSLVKREPCNPLPLKGLPYRVNENGSHLAQIL